jgi:Cu+-exporting ATPase
MGTIEKALGRMDGVGQVAVSLTHKQALVDYEPGAVAPERILAALRDIGYEVYDPRKLRPSEEEERQLVGEGVRLLAAIAASLSAIGLIATVTGIASVLVPLSVVVVMVPLSYVLLRRYGPVTAAAEAAAIVAPGLTALALRAAGVLPGRLADWLAVGLAVTVVAGVAHPILRMAYQSLRRGILNQHVLLEIGAFAGLAGRGWLTAGHCSRCRWQPAGPVRVRRGRAAGLGRARTRRAGRLGARRRPCCRGRPG